MIAFSVLPIPGSMVDTVRAELVSPQYGHPAHVETAKGYGPCRSCLRTFDVGNESRILFTYNPFEGLEDYPSPGPVFVHRDPCQPFAGQGFPDTLRPLPLTLEAYGEHRWILDRARAEEGGAVESAIERLLAHEGVRYLHIRNTEAGCFIAHISPLPK